MNILEAVLYVVSRQSGCDDITLETRLADLPLDSLDMLQVLIEIENETGAGISPANLGEFETVEDLVLAAEGRR